MVVAQQGQFAALSIQKVGRVVFFVCFDYYARVDLCRGFEEIECFSGVGAFAIAYRFVQLVSGRFVRVSDSIVLIVLGSDTALGGRLGDFPTRYLELIFYRFCFVQSGHRHIAQQADRVVRSAFQITHVDMSPKYGWRWYLIAVHTIKFRNVVFAFQYGIAVGNNVNVGCLGIDIIDGQGVVAEIAWLDLSHCHKAALVTVFDDI